MSNLPYDEVQDSVSGHDKPFMILWSWNVNSVRTVDMATPLSKTDVLCLQETKIAKSNVTWIDDWDAFYAFPRRHAGTYSGVATYCRQGLASPLAVEFGLVGVSIGGHELVVSNFTSTQLLELDSEGRIVISDHSLFVLVNVYFPMDASVERHEFKLNFHLAVQLRIQGLLELGRQVLLVGDVRLCLFLV